MNKISNCASGKRSWTFKSFLFLSMLTAASCSHFESSPVNRLPSADPQQPAPIESVKDFENESTADVIPGSKEERERAASLVEYRNCQLAPIRFPEFFKNDTVECTDDYLLFESKQKTTITKRKIKIGSFNIIRIGQAQTRFKRNDFVAEMMEQWDLVTVVEIMTMGKEHLSYNQKVDSLAQSLTDEKLKKNIEPSYEIPRYLLILKELRKRDPAWSLIMAPQGTGETTASYEYVGFFYRNGLVENTKTKFCGDKRGCLTPISRENYENIVSRSPFVARFKAGKLDFNAAGLHLRFRAPAEDCSTSGAATGKGKKKCVDYSRAELDIVNEYLKAAEKTKINKEDARYLELAVAHRVLERSEEEVLVMGDFNLEFKERTKKLWNFSVGHENIFVNEPTSISALNGLANQYDHFVFVPEKNLASCDINTARAFNFVLDVNNPVTSEPALKNLASFLSARKNKQALLKAFSEDLKKDQVLSCEGQICKMVPRYTAEQATNLACLYERNVLGNDSKTCKVASEDEAEEGDEDASGATPTKKLPYKVYHEVISDHIPIEMECSI